MSGDGDRRFGHAPLVWRSTLRGVLVHGDEIRLLEGLAAAIWVVLDDGARSVPAVVQALEDWSLDVDPEDVEAALTALVDLGLLVS